MTSIVALAPQHARDAARLHIAGQPGTFLTSLGPSVLTVLYQALPRSPVGFGFAALNPDPQSMNSIGVAALEDEPLIGFVGATTSVGRLFVEMGTRRLGQFVPPLCSRFLRHPSLALRSVQTLLYPFTAGNAQKHGSVAHSNDARGAELLAIMVEPDQRSRGIGGQLLQALLEACRTRGLSWLDVTVDAGNGGACRFYAGHGFVHTGNFELYGRAMCLYRRKLATPVTSASVHAEQPDDQA